MSQEPTLVPGMMLAVCVWAGMLSVTFAEATPGTPDEDATRRAAAVTLNYSRASFHRIRRNPTLRVLQEEQEKILDHLDLNGVADQEVLQLYSAVLDEIAQIQLADRERDLLKGKHRQQFQSQLGFSVLALTTQMATAQYASAVRTGAASWWDFRNFSTNRDLDIHRIDRERMNKLVEKSTRFLDVSWKMARDKRIPDRWLVRGDDLDKLEAAWQEPDPTTRLRVLKRMEPFMECYPPYWYYVARTEQSLGHLPIAAGVYGRMVDVGQGHFRKDDMLAAGLANRAIIQAYLADPEAPRTARAALDQSTDVWEANILCAAVLQQSRELDAAEDAILRNLDVDLERTQSRVALVALYAESEQAEKLAAQLGNLEVVKVLPIALLLRSATVLGTEAAPPLLAQVLERSLQATPRSNFGRDDLVLQATANWQLERAKLRLTWGDGAYINPRFGLQGEHTVATFEGIGEWSAGEPRTVELTIEYPDLAPLVVTLQPAAEPTSGTGGPASLLAATRRAAPYRVARYDQALTRVAVSGGRFLTIAGGPSPAESPQLARPLKRDDLPDSRPVRTTTFKPVLDDDPYFTTPEIEIPLR